MFEAADVRQILADAKQPLKAMVLLAVNCGFGQTDLARLPVASVDLDTRMIDYPRPKTEAPATLSALSGDRGRDSRVDTPQTEGERPGGFRVVVRDVPGCPVRKDGEERHAHRR